LLMLLRDSAQTEPRPPHHVFFGKACSEILTNRTGNENGRCIMRHHDFVSEGFLALTAAGIVLLCSSLLAIAFS
jgi:hypothetical protein